MWAIYCCDCDDIIIIEDERGERCFCKECGNEIYNEPEVEK